MDDPILISRNVECGTLHCTGGNAKPRYTAQNTYSTHNRKFDNREVQVTGAEQYFCGFHFVNHFKKNTAVAYVYTRIRQKRICYKKSPISKRQLKLRSSISKRQLNKGAWHF